jgi:hypothetical protein
VSDIQNDRGSTNWILPGGNDRFIYCNDRFIQKLLYLIFEYSSPADVSWRMRAHQRRAGRRSNLIREVDQLGTTIIDRLIAMGKHSKQPYGRPCLVQRRGDFRLGGTGGQPSDIENATAM